MVAATLDPLALDVTVTFPVPAVAEVPEAAYESISLYTVIASSVATAECIYPFFTAMVFIVKVPAEFSETVPPEGTLELLVVGAVFPSVV